MDASALGVFLVLGGYVWILNNLVATSAPATPHTY